MSTSGELILGGSVAIIAVAIVFRKRLATVSIKSALLILLGVCIAFGAKEIAAKAREIRDKLP